MTPAARDATFQLFGALLGLAIALGGTFAATSFLGRIGVLAIVWALPTGVFTGWASTKLLRFAHQVLSDQD